MSRLKAKRYRWKRLKLFSVLNALAKLLPRHSPPATQPPTQYFTFFVFHRFLRRFLPFRFIWSRDGMKFNEMLIKCNEIPRSLEAPANGIIRHQRAKLLSSSQELLLNLSWLQIEANNFISWAAWWTLLSWKLSNRVVCWVKNSEEDNQLGWVC